MWPLSILKAPPKRHRFIKVKPKKRPVKITIGGPRKAFSLGPILAPKFNFTGLKPPKITLPGADVFPDEAPPEQVIEPGQDVVKAVPEGPVEAIKEKMKGTCKKLGIPCWMVGIGGLAALWIIFK